jgi:hypothetical protein
MEIHGVVDHNTQRSEILVQTFLADHVNPSRQEWKDFLEAHRELLGHIVDAAISRIANANAAEVPDEVFFDKATFDQTIGKIVSQAETTPPATLINMH